VLGGTVPGDWMERIDGWAEEATGGEGISPDKNHAFSRR